MNSIPKTNSHPYGSFTLPVVIDQSRYSVGINHYCYSMEYFDRYKMADNYTIAIFRVYPKGQNPESIKRRKNVVFGQQVQNGLTKSPSNEVLMPFQYI